MDVRPGNERRESGQKLERLEDDRARAIAPGTSDAQQHSAIGRTLEGILGDGRTEDVTGQMLEPCAIPRRHRHSRMQIEATDIGVARVAQALRCGMEARPEPLRTHASVRPHGGDSGDRCSGEARENGRLLGEGVDAHGLGTLAVEVDAVALCQPHDSATDRGKQPLDLAIGRCRQRDEAKPA